MKSLYHMDDPIYKPYRWMTPDESKIQSKRVPIRPVIARIKQIFRRRDEFSNVSKMLMRHYWGKF